MLTDITAATVAAEGQEIAIILVDPGCGCCSYVPYGVVEAGESVAEALARIGGVTIEEVVFDRF